LAALAACEDVPLAPTWNSDFYLPIQFADVTLGPSGVTKKSGGLIPAIAISDTSPVGTQEVSGATKQLLDENVNSILADVIFSTSADLTGTIQISVAPNQADLFSADPTKAFTTTVTIRKTAGDTSHVTANVNVFRTSSQTNNGTCTINCGTNNNSNSGSATNTLYTQSRTTVACKSGICVVTDNDKLQLGINLTVNVAVSK